MSRNVLPAAVACRIAVVGLLTLAAYTATHAAVIEVNSNASFVSTNDGRCTLIEAITSANADAPSGPAQGECAAGAGGDTITLQPGADYALQAPQHTANGPTALPAITSSVIIAGNAAVIERDDGAPSMRLFVVLGGGALRLENVTLQRGAAADVLGGGAVLNLGGDVSLQGATLTGNYSPCDGAGISSYSGTLFIAASRLEANNAWCSGGGLRMQDGPVVIEDTQLIGNRALSGGGGGAMIAGSATADLLRVRIQDNSAALDGGGLLAHGASTRVSLADSLVIDNVIAFRAGQLRGGNGGGLANGRLDNSGAVSILVDGGEMSLSNSRVAGNRALREPGVIGSVFGGGISNAGRLSVAGGSEISGNRADDGSGGGVFSLGPFPGRQLAISSSVIRDNVASGPGRGGGLFVLDTPVAISHSRIESNLAVSGGGIAGARLFFFTMSSSALIGNEAENGAAMELALEPGALDEMLNSTISGNRVLPGASGAALEVLGTLDTRHLTLVDNFGGRGGLYNRGSVTLHHALVAGNRNAAGAAADCISDTSALWSYGYSLVGRDGGCPTGSGPGMTDVEGTQLFSTVVAALSSNGHPITMSHALLPGSPALDRGSPVTSAGGDPWGCMSVDQLERLRPHDGDGDGVAICDIGAIEAIVVDVFADGFETMP